MKHALLAVALLALASCGFRPVYGDNKHTFIGVEEQLSYVRIGNIPDREGQFLRNELIDRFYRDGRPLEALYALDIAPLYESSTKLDITKDADSTRGQLKMTTTLTLRDAETGKTLLERPLTAIASYNILASEFTNRISRKNARENVLRDLARQIEQQLALYFKRRTLGS